MTEAEWDPPIEPETVHEADLSLITRLCASCNCLQDHSFSMEEITYEGDPDRYAIGVVWCSICSTLDEISIDIAPKAS